MVNEESGDSGKSANQSDRPVPFGYKCIWLAVKTRDTEALVRALGLTAVRDAGWAQGVEAAYEGEVFVSPPVEDWTLALSVSLPAPQSSAPDDPCMEWLTKLGTQFPEVQYFASHRVVEFFVWAKIKDGNLVRAWAYAGDRGETIWDIGPKSDEENRLELHYFDENCPESFEESYWLRPDLTFPEEDHVMELAGAWSVNPITLERYRTSGSGHLGAWEQ